MQNWQQVCADSKLLSSLTSWKSDVTPSCRSLLAFKMLPFHLERFSESPVQKRPWNILRWEIFNSSAGQVKHGNSGTCKWVSVLCHPSSPCRLWSGELAGYCSWQSSGACKWGRHTLAASAPANGSRACHNDAISIPSLAKILVSISMIKLKSCVSFSWFSGDS